METKVDIISGFLGAGKTTLIKKLLEEKTSCEKLVIIENEFGEVGIDGSLLKKSGIEIKEINSGCICCTLVGDFEKSISEIIEKFKPDRIIIEPSGVGKLSEVLKACKALKSKENLKINMLITVVDASKYDLYLSNFGEFYKNQITYARTIILSRTKKVSKEKLEKLVSSVRKLNSKSHVITTPWENLKAEQIIEVAEQDIAVSLKNQLIHVASTHKVRSYDSNYRHCHKQDNHPTGCICGHDHGHQHSADEVFDVWGVETPKTFDESQLRNVFNILQNNERYGTILRAKGFLQMDNDTWIQFDYVPGEIKFNSISPDYTGRVCIIGIQLNKTALDSLFELAV